MKFLTLLKSRHRSDGKMTYRKLSTIFNGHQLANQIKEEVKEELLKLQLKTSHLVPQFVAVTVGNNPASRIYVERKKEAAQFCGIKSQVIELCETTTEETVLSIIHRLNQDKSVHGIIVQLPLPSHMSEISVCNAVHPSKDVDGFTQTNLGRLMQGLSSSTTLPCTATAVQRILTSTGLDTLGRNAVVIGRSHNVGLPISILLGADTSKGGFDMTTVSCHRATPPGELARACLGADLIVSAAGVPNLVTKDMVKPGAILIDVGLNRFRTSGGRDVVRGDFSYDVREVASIVTPVPGGVGPCTVACLMYNTVRAARALAGCQG